MSSDAVVIGALRVKYLDSSGRLSLLQMNRMQTDSVPVTPFSFLRNIIMRIGWEKYLNGLPVHYNPADPYQIIATTPRE